MKQTVLLDLKECWFLILSYFSVKPTPPPGCPSLISKLNLPQYSLLGRKIKLWDFIVQWEDKQAKRVGKLVALVMAMTPTSCVTVTCVGAILLYLMRVPASTPLLKSSFVLIHFWLTMQRHTFCIRLLCMDESVNSFLEVSFCCYAIT